MKKLRIITFYTTMALLFLIFSDITAADTSFLQLDPGLGDID